MSWNKLQAINWLTKKKYTTRNMRLISCVWGKDGSLRLGRTLKTNLIQSHITQDDSHVITLPKQNLSSTFFEDGRSFSRLDLPELPFKVRWGEHMHGETSHLDQNDPILALGSTRVRFIIHHNSGTAGILHGHIRHGWQREEPLSPATAQHGYGSPEKPL